MAVSDHEADHVQRWIERKQREGGITNWQLMQMVDAPRTVEIRATADLKSTQEVKQVSLSGEHTPGHAPGAPRAVAHHPRLIVDLPHREPRNVRLHRLPNFS